MECVNKIRAPVRWKVQRAPAPGGIQRNQKIRVRARRLREVPWMCKYLVGCWPVQLKKYQPKVLTLVKPGP